MDYTITVPVSHETSLILDGLAHLEGILLATQAQIDALAGRISAAAADIRADIADHQGRTPRWTCPASRPRWPGWKGWPPRTPRRPAPNPVRHPTARASPGGRGGRTRMAAAVKNYISHLADDGDPRVTACGEPWQGWQEPDNAPRVIVDPPHDPPRPHADQIRMCQACLRVAVAS